MTLSSFMLPLLRTFALYNFSLFEILPSVEGDLRSAVILISSRGSVPITVLGSAVIPHLDSQPSVTARHLSLFYHAEHLCTLAPSLPRERDVFRSSFFFCPVIRSLSHLIGSGIPKTTAHRPQSALLHQSFRRWLRQASRSPDDSRLITLM